MNIKIKTLSFISGLMILLMSPVIAHLINNYTNTHFSCDSKYSAVYEDFFLTSKNNLVIDGEEGSWVMEGKISRSDEEPLFFKIINKFNVSKVNFSYHFITQKVNIIPNNASYKELLSKFLAKGAINENTDTFFNIYSMDNNYLIYSGTMPIMYCLGKN